MIDAQKTSKRLKNTFCSNCFKFLRRPAFSKHLQPRAFSKSLRVRTDSRFLESRLNLFEAEDEVLHCCSHHGLQFDLASQFPLVAPSCIFQLTTVQSFDYGLIPTSSTGGSVLPWEHASHVRDRRQRHLSAHSVVESACLHEGVADSSFSRVNALASGPADWPVPQPHLQLQVIAS